MTADAHVTILLDGARMRVPAGTSVAAALLNASIPARRSVTGEPRTAVCGMGICHECRVTVDGRAHVRGCMTTVAEGMAVTRDA